MFALINKLFQQDTKETQEKSNKFFAPIGVTRPHNVSKSTRIGKARANQKQGKNMNGITDMDTHTGMCCVGLNLIPYSYTEKKLILAI